VKEAPFETIASLSDQTHDIADVRIKTVVFAKCPISGWFFNHWGLILEREDGRYVTVQFVKSGCEIDRAGSLEHAKEPISRCSNANVENVQTMSLGKPNRCSTVGQIINAASQFEREYSFFSYNCRHFVLDVL